MELFKSIMADASGADHLNGGGVDVADSRF